MKIPAVLLAAILLCFCPILAFSQNKLVGEVRDESGKVLPFVNVILLQARDSATVKGTLSNAEGGYQFDQVKSGDYLIMGYLLGYQKKYSSSFKVQQDQAEGPSLQLSPESQLLKEVQVKGQKPFVEQEIDRTIVNVANSVVSGGSTALEVLQKAPGVFLDDQSNQLQLQGREGVLVQVNGRTSYLPAQQVLGMLRSLPSDQIDKIEIIPHPSAQYDAAGNAGVINVLLKKNNQLGTNGSLSVTGGSGQRPRERSSLQLNHHSGKFNAFLSYSFDREGNFFDFRFNRDQTQDEETNLIEQHSRLRQLTLTHNLRASLDYAFNQFTTLGVNWTAFLVSDRDRGLALTKISHGGQDPFLVALTRKTIDSRSQNHVVNLNLRHQFRDQKGELTADLDGGRYTSFFSNRLATVLEQGIGTQDTEPTRLLTEIPTFLSMQVAKVDLNRPVFGNWKVETGFKSSHVVTDNDVRLLTGSFTLEVDSSRSNQFRYTESLNAAYFSLAGKISPKTDVQAGLRAEHTASTGNTNFGQHLVKKNYLDLFPSIFASHELTADHTLSFSYGYRIDRPGYQDLSPSYSFIDPYSYHRGNPNLRPQYTHAFELRHGFKNKIFTSVGANHVQDYIFLANRVPDSYSQYITRENLDERRGYTLTVSFPVTVTKYWNLQANVMGLYNRYRYLYLETPMEFKQVASRLNFSNTITLPHDFRLEVAARYNTPSVWGIWQRQQSGSLDVGVQKTVASRLKLRLTAQDLLYTDRTRMNLNMPDAVGEVHILQDNRFFLLGLTYEFGNQQLKPKRRNTSGSDDEMNRVGGGNGF
jgi:hypothetical protein